jgi:hypothetical protein
MKNIDEEIDNMLKFREFYNNIKYSIYKIINNITWPFRKFAYRIKIFKQLWEYLFASWDIVGGIEKSLEILFVDWYENSLWKTETDWDWCEEKKQTKRNIEMIYQWLKYDKLANETEIEVLHKLYFGLNPHDFFKRGKYYQLGSKYKIEMCREYLNIAREKEKYVKTTHDYMLTKIILIKDELWV